jgi:choline dehydrogenase-like flavoprotein
MLTDTQRATLRALCDTAVPRIERAEDPHGFWARTASDVGADQALEGLLAQGPDADRHSIAQLLDALHASGLTEETPLEVREQILQGFSASSAEVAAGVQGLVGGALFLAFGLPDPQTGQNPFWKTFGYPGPTSLPPDVPKEIETFEPEEDITADVVIVGSGAGGGTIAGTLARHGLDVVVLEAAGYFNEADFNQLELWAYQNLYWRGGPTPTADGNVSLQAGTSLGGGTTINWTNCLRTRPWVRAQWASEHGLADVDTPAFDAHLDTVLDRIGATDACSDFNGPTQLMRAGAEKLGWSFIKVIRNADPAKYDPVHAGYSGFGDQSGAKLSTTKTFLKDAAEHGARIVVNTRALRVITDGGRAAGVETDRGFAVRAPIVVVAAGALESPALLLRSGIGGPAVGDYLRLHPCSAVTGTYGRDTEAFWGAPHTGLVDEFANLGDGYGFLLETAQYTTAVAGAAVPWTSGAEHKEFMHDFRRSASFIALLRDHGHGRVTIDANGAAVPTYSLEDDGRDAANAYKGIEAMIRVHEAAGAEEIASLAAGMPRWQRGEDLEQFIARATQVPLRAGGQKLFSAHQMGTCRMGTDRQTSVADARGELHDTPGVWIGDGSAFPTASGTNPMVSIMGLAHRTAQTIAAEVGATASAPSA